MDGLVVNVDLDVGIAEKVAWKIYCPVKFTLTITLNQVKMGRRRVETKLLDQHQRQECKERVIKGRSSASKMVTDGEECGTPQGSVSVVQDGVENVNVHPQGSVPVVVDSVENGSVKGSRLGECVPVQGAGGAGSPLRESDSEEEIPSSQPLAVTVRRRSSKQAKEIMRKSFSATKRRRKEAKLEEVVSGVVTTTCPETGDQCFAVLTSNLLVHFHRRASSGHPWTPKGSTQLPLSLSLLSPFSMSLLATGDSLELQTFSADEQSVREDRTGVVGDNLNSSMLLFTEQEDVVLEVLTCSLSPTSAAVFWNLLGGKASGAVYDWGKVNGVKKQVLTHLASLQKVKVTGVAKIDGKRMVAVSTSDCSVFVWSFDTGQRLSRLSLDTSSFNPGQTPSRLLKMATDGEHNFCFVISGTCLKVLVVRPNYPALQPLSLKIPPHLAARSASTTGAKVVVQGPIISLLVAGAIVRWQIQQNPISSTVSFVDPPFQCLDVFFV